MFWEYLTLFFSLCGSTTSIYGLNNENENMNDIKIMQFFLVINSLCAAYTIYKIADNRNTLWHRQQVKINYLDLVNEYALLEASFDNMSDEQKSNFVTLGLATRSEATSETHLKLKQEHFCSISLSLMIQPITLYVENRDAMQNITIQEEHYEKFWIEKWLNLHDIDMGVPIKNLNLQSPLTKRIIVKIDFSSSFEKKHSEYINNLKNAIKDNQKSMRLGYATN